MLRYVTIRIYLNFLNFKKFSFNMKNFFTLTNYYFNFISIIIIIISQ